MTRAAVALPGEPSRSSRRWLTPWRAALALGVLAVGAVVVAMALRGAPVATHRVSAAPFVERVVATGRVLAPAEVRLATVVLGKVVRVAVDEGDRVKAGDVLIELDDTEAQAALAQAKAAVAHASAVAGQVRGVSATVASERLKAAQARFTLAESDHARRKKLFEAGAITAAELDEATKALDVARTERDAAKAEAASVAPGGNDLRVALASVAQAEAGREVAAARLELLRVVAPANGIVLRRSVEPGDVVTPAQTLLLLSRHGPTRIAVPVDEANLGRLAIGQRGQASAEAFPADRFEVAVLSVSPAVDAARGTVQVKLEVPAPPAFLRPDMTVSVDIEVGRREGVMALPPEALHDAASASPWVLVVDGGRARRRAVSLGVRTADRVEVRAGLSEGELVVLPGEKAVADGARVRVAAPAAVGG